MIDLSQYVSKLVAEGPPVFFPQPEMPIYYNFDQGNPGTETFPLDELAVIEEKIRSDIGGPAYDYFDAATGYEELVFGWRGLRSVLAQRFSARDSRQLDADNFILSSGSVQGIALVAKAFLDPGDVVFVESVSFPYALKFFEAAGAEIVPIPMDENGLIPAALKAAVSEARAQGRQPKLLYTIPTFQLPTGVCMPLERRRELVDLAQQESLLVHEDNVYAELRYSGDPIPTIFSLDNSGLVLQSDSFSKTVAPALRMGWVMGSAEAIAALGAVRQDLGINQFLARVLAEYVTSGRFDSHVDSVRKVYGEKRDTAVAALREHCADWVNFNVPDGSFFLWLEISPDVDWDLAAQKVARAGVFCRPGERFAGTSSGPRYLRMAFSNVSPQNITDGIQALGQALRTSVREEADT